MTKLLIRYQRTEDGDLTLRLRTLNHASESQGTHKPEIVRDETTRLVTSYRDRKALNNDSGASSAYPGSVQSFATLVFTYNILGII